MVAALVATYCHGNKEVGRMGGRIYVCIRYFYAGTIFYYYPCVNTPKALGQHLKRVYGRLESYQNSYLRHANYSCSVALALVIYSRTRRGGLSQKLKDGFGITKVEEANKKTRRGREKIRTKRGLWDITAGAVGGAGGNTLQSQVSKVTLVMLPRLKASLST
ncbi:hypothetical protein ElyMa_002232100 [Elysia marginata]|uniref:Uncharacterized protein n=1 Tax=Elysia marginata TaxID=1093978 RepID=A0AAV4FVX5_9GAST|nr:hypothetical protein ElyMa_002232100 [Elysia marginata]